MTAAIAPPTDLIVSSVGPSNSFRPWTSSSPSVATVDANGNVLDQKQLKALGKMLKKADKELFKAITDAKHHVTINAIQQ